MSRAFAADDQVEDGESVCPAHCGEQDSDEPGTAEQHWLIVEEWDVHARTSCSFADTKWTSGYER